MTPHNLFLLMKLVSIVLSCVWFSHPLSWEQWFGAVSLNLKPSFSLCLVSGGKRKENLACISYFPSCFPLQTLNQTLLILIWSLTSGLTVCLAPYQVIVFGSLYAKSFLKNIAQKPSQPNENMSNGAPSPRKVNPWRKHEQWGHDWMTHIQWMSKGAFDGSDLLWPESSRYVCH